MRPLNHFHVSSTQEETKVGVFFHGDMRHKAEERTVRTDQSRNGSTVKRDFPEDNDVFMLISNVPAGGLAGAVG